tara:strand:- start:83 stop:412 length:330 start_codon:yes stop_codon:yes gene_type:complete
MMDVQEMLQFIYDQATKMGNEAIEKTLETADFGCGGSYIHMPRKGRFYKWAKENGIGIDGWPSGYNLFFNYDNNTQNYLANRAGAIASLKVLRDSELVDDKAHVRSYDT